MFLLKIGKVKAEVDYIFKKINSFGYYVFVNGM